MKQDDLMRRGGLYAFECDVLTFAFDRICANEVLFIC